MWFRSKSSYLNWPSATRAHESRKRRPQRRPQRRRAAARLRLEGLETRCLLTFMAPVEYGATSPSIAVAAGDFSNNGIQDLAVAGLESVSILMGKGDGTFQPAKTYAAGSSNIASVAVGDLTGDGKLDIVAANEGSPGDPYSGVLPVPGSVSVLMGNGDGTFRSPITFNLPGDQEPFSLALGDMNHDGRLDVVVAATISTYNAATYSIETYDGVDVLLGHGDGTFSLSSTALLGQYGSLGGSESLALGDFNRDGKLDVATTVGDALAVLAGNGDGTLAPPTDFATGAPALSVTAGDITGDGKLDLVTGNASGSVSVLLGNGDGAFQPPIVSDLPTWNGQAQSAGAAVVGDLNGDGKMDLAVTASYYSVSNYSFNFRAIILLGNGQGSFTVAQTVPLGYSYYSRGGSITAADFNSDGYPDLAVANGSYGDFSALLNGANWSTTPPTAASFAVSGFPSSTTAGTAGSFTVTALNPDGTVDTGYTGTVRFSGSDGQASLPATYTFTAANEGAHTFSATLKTAGTQSITATDTSTGTLTGSETAITVVPAAASHFAVSAPASSTAGNPFSVTVTALDPYDNTATGYTGTVHFTTSDPKHVLPANYTFTSADAGQHTFSATLKTAGTQSITATDTRSASLHGNDAGITVNPAAASKFILVAPASVQPGVPFSLTVTVEDQYGNIVTGYVGTIHFTSNDSRATLPANYTFTAADNGVHTFTGLVLRKTGNQTITVTDTHISRISGKRMVDVV